MPGLRSDRVRAIGIFKSRPCSSNENDKVNGPRLVEAVKAIPIVQQNLLKYELSFKAERLGKTLANDLGLQDTDFSVMVLVEGASHEKIREALMSPEYRKVVSGALEHSTALENYHWFSAEFVTVIDK